MSEVSRDTVPRLCKKCASVAYHTFARGVQGFGTFARGLQDRVPTVPVAGVGRALVRIRKYR